ncbi:MAG: DUF4835 domain-containing protein [Bacteroidetes bacterium]|nr:MAG: DUF4835 domain-containing protein [Bacteroidota bacterium]
MAKKLAILLLVILMAGKGFSQDFYCTIQIQTPKIQGVDPTIFEALKTSIYEFMNNRKWSEYNFKTEERIECTMVLTIEQAISSDEFKGTLNIVQQRPVFNTDYQTPLLNMVDKDIHIRYTPYQNMEYADNTFTSNLTSILAFYAYTMLGMDFDSFAEQGGTSYLQKAKDVVTAAQNSNEKGWGSFDGTKTRYSLIENLLNSSYNNLRTFNYRYHRLGLDVMSKDVMKGRAEINKNLKLLKNIYNKRPGLYLLQIIIEAKRDEMINIFKNGDPAEKSNFIEIMKDIDAANSSKYNRVMR